MLKNINTNSVLFLDIETVRETQFFKDLDSYSKQLWTEKAKLQLSNVADPSEYYEKNSGLMAEFAKIICISVGYLFVENGKKFLRLKSFVGDNEKALLLKFNHLLNSVFNQKNYLLCAHNGIYFDFPFIAKRIIINNLKLPEILDLYNKKPWEIKHLDTMSLWRFGDYKNYTSIKLLAKILNIASPKDDIEGDQVGQIYYDTKDFERIKNYCQKDTITVAQLLLRYKGEELIEQENIQFV